MTTGTDTQHARETYDAFAPHYDLFTAHHDYEAWTATLEQLAQRHGLRGRRLLDVACGTGKSFLPMLARGYEVTACDISPAMVARAAHKASGRAQVGVCDMRELPTLGRFDLVWCLDDAVNYLLDGAELVRWLRGLRRNLAPGGLILFDANALSVYRTVFASISVVIGEDVVLVWDGDAGSELATGEVATARVEALEREQDGTWRRSVCEHRQRHHPRESVELALYDAGLDLVGVRGMCLDGSLTDSFDELENSKAVYLARASAPER
jgi:SAM-dependent methyltransferase